MNTKYTKKIVIAFAVLIITSCSSTLNKSTDKSLFEVLTQQNDGGAGIRFFEILTEPNEIKMLLSDDNLKRKIDAKDITSCNFIILNMGEKKANGYSISIKNILETADKIIIETVDKEPEKISPTDSNYVYPYTIVKINSKKEIIIK